MLALICRVQLMEAKNCQMHESYFFSSYPIFRILLHKQINEESPNNTSPPRFVLPPVSHCMEFMQCNIHEPLFISLFLSLPLMSVAYSWALKRRSIWCHLSVQWEHRREGCLVRWGKGLIDTIAQSLV